jgi:hypothetical protein
MKDLNPKVIKTLKEKQYDALRKAWKYKRLFQKCQAKQHELTLKIESLTNSAETVAT